MLEYNIGHLEVLYKRVSPNNTLDARSLSVKSLLAHENGRYGEAVNFLGWSIILEPGVSNYQKQFAKTCVKMSLWKHALKALNRAIFADPSDPESWYGLGFIYDRTENMDNAKFCYVQSLALDPSSRKVRSALATLDSNY